MKVIAPLLLLMCIASCSKAQLFASAKETIPPMMHESPLLVKHGEPVPYKVSMPPGLKMRNVGRTLTIIGGAMLIGGIIVYNNADPYYDYGSQYTTSYTQEEQQAALGVLMIMGGTGMTIPGIIFWSKGAKKYKRHLEREAAFNFQGTGVSLSYRF